MELAPLPRRRDEILRGVLQQGADDLSPELARHLLTLDFREEDHDRVEELAAKAGEGTLTEDERDEYAFYIDLDDFLSLLKLKAQRHLGRAG